MTAGRCDRDGDGLTNDEEAALGTDPMSADSDGDGIPDPSDPDIVGDFVAALPAGAFAAPGHRTALLSLYWYQTTDVHANEKLAHFLTHEAPRIDGQAAG